MNEKQRLLHKFSKRQCSPEELKILFSYLKNDPAAEYEEVMDEIWMELHATPHLRRSVSDEMYQQISDRIQFDQPSGSSKQIARRMFLFDSRGLAFKVAATFAGIMLGIWMLHLLVLNPKQVHKTSFGATASILLPDSSIVTLNGNSRIQYKKHWDTNEVREVWLEGEAFFSVTHTANDQKFVVHTNNLEIAVLGTEFNVNNRRGETKVTLTSGAVMLNGKGSDNPVKNVLMHPGEQALLNKQKEFSLKKIDTRQFTTWKDNTMIFDHTPVPDIAVMIEETYGLDVVLRGDSIHHLKLTGYLPATDIHALLGMLKETLELDVVLDDDHVIISSP